MSVIVSDYSEGKEKSMDKGLIEVLKAKIDLPCPHIRRWVCLCAGKLWTNSENAKAAALSEKVRSFTVILFRWYFRGFDDAFLRGAPEDSTKILNKIILPRVFVDGRPWFSDHSWLKPSGRGFRIEYQRCELLHSMP